MLLDVLKLDKHEGHFVSHSRHDSQMFEIPAYSLAQYPMLHLKLHETNVSLADANHIKCSYILTANSNIYTDTCAIKLPPYPCIYL